MPPEDGWRVGIGLQWELWDGGQRYQKLAQAQSQSRLAELGILQRDDELQTEARRRRDAIEKSQLELELSKERLALTLKAQDLTQNAYDEGGASLEDLLEIQGKSLDAELGVLKARTEYDLAWLNWRTLIE